MERMFAPELPRGGIGTVSMTLTPRVPGSYQLVLTDDSGSVVKTSEVVVVEDDLHSIVLTVTGLPYKSVIYNASVLQVISDQESVFDIDIVETVDALSIIIKEGNFRDLFIAELGDSALADRLRNVVVKFQNKALAVRKQQIELDIAAEKERRLRELDSKFIG